MKIWTPLLIKFVPEMHTLALERAAKHPVTRSNKTPYSGNKNFPMGFIGFGGEIVFEYVMKRMRIHAEYVNKTEHDYRVFDYTVEVKTQTCESPPSDHYEGNVPDRLFKHQVADFYFFIRLQGDSNTMDSYRHAYLCGMASRQTMLEKGVHNAKGSTVNKLPEPCQSIAYKHCHSPFEFGQVLQAARLLL